MERSPHYPHTWKIGDSVRLPDGPWGPIIDIQEGIEYGDAVLYVTVAATFGPVTRWVHK